MVSSLHVHKVYAHSKNIKMLSLQCNMILLAQAFQNYLLKCIIIYLTDV